MRTLKNITGSTALILFAAVSLAMVAATRTQAFAQDITLHETITSAGMRGQGERTATSITYITAKAIKNTSPEGQDTIIRFDEGKIITIDNTNRTYTEMTTEQLNQMLEKLPGKEGENAEKMEALRKMMGQAASSYSVTKEGPGETIAGYSTEKYLLKGPIEYEIWAAPALKMPTLFFDVMKSRMPKNPMFDMGKLYDEMKKIQGMPLKTVMTMKMMNMEMKTTTVVTSVEKTPIPPSTFQVPAGYKLLPNKF